MKRLNNILSYLWSLLLLLTLTTCSDWEEIVVTMQGEEEVELNIQTTVPDMQAITRTAPTESITAITALAFDGDSELIKVATATLTNQQGTTGTLSITVPLRTRSIHFLAKNEATFDTSTFTLGTIANDLLLNATTTDLHYWAMLQFDGATDLQSLEDELAAAPNKDNKLTLYRNMAKVTLVASEGSYIAGFLNYNSQGTLVPSEYTIGTINAVSSLASHAAGNLGTEHYLFEHANEKNNNPLYAICNIGGKYYKIAFAYTNNEGGVTYFDILRNNAYRIVISDIDEMYGEDSFVNAKNSYPINDLVIAEGDPLTINATPAELPTTQGGTCSVTVAIPEGITELMVDADAAFTVIPLNDLTTNSNGSYAVTTGDYRFTLTVNANATTGDKKVSFNGRGKYITATGNTTIRLYENATLSISPTSVYNTAGSTTTVSVPIPQGITSLTATSEAFIVTSNEVSLNNGSFDVRDKQGQSVTFTLTLKDGGVGTVGDTRTITFAGTDGNYKRAMGTATVTLAEAPAQGSLPVYELWFEENNGWNGSTDYATFFTKNGDITTGNDNAGNMESTFYDGTFTVNDVTYSGADSHRLYAMTMGGGKSIGFIITETRYLTLLVASSGNAPSINLSGTLSEGSWATENSSAAVVPTNYNFGNGEIGTNGRLICYTLPAGTYTLQRGSNDYLLYYMRVSTTKPTMTDIVQPAASDYSLSWSGNNGGYLKDPNNDAKYFVDEEATNFIPTLTYNGLSEVSLSTVKLDVTTDVWTFDNSDDSSQGSMQQDTRNYTEANISSLAYNEGAYTLSGSVTGISATSYKYATFYDNLQVKSVSFNVKNTVKVALYNSWDSNAQPVTEFVKGGENNILGFKMPQYTLPVNPRNSEKINFTIDNSWQLNQPGAGIYQVEGSNYQIGDQQSQQDNQSMHYHPRTEWTYKMSWNNIPSNTITPTSTTDDVYFSYNGEISKNPTITTTQGAETPLNITVWTGERALEWSTNYLIVDKQIPTGSEVTLNFTSTDDGKFKLHEKTGGANIIALPNVDYGSNSDNLGIISVNSGQTSYSFDVSNDIKVNNQNINGYLNGLAINGTGVTMTSIVVKYPDGYVEEEGTVVFEYNFDNGNMDGISGWGNSSSRTIDNKALKLTNPSVTNNVYDVQVAIDREYEEGNYTLTFDIWGFTSGDSDAIQQVFQYYHTTKNDDGSETTKYDDASDYQEVSVTAEPITITLKNISVSACNRFLFNIGEFEGDIYIDNLKLVKNN